MRTIRLTATLDDAAADALGGTYMTEDRYDELVDDEDATVLKPDGSVLLVYRAGCLPKGTLKPAYEALRRAATPTDNRGLAAGRLDQDALTETTTIRPRAIGSRSATRFFPVKSDGTVSRTQYAKTVHSGIVGYFDRYPRIPYCRTTAYNLERPEVFARALPFIRAVDAVFAREAPERHAAQMSAIRRTHPDFYIHGTSFTTITVNKNWQTAVHQDAGDYRPGFGVMAVLQAGRYAGANLVFPAYRVAVNMRTGGVCLADVHHATVPLDRPTYDYFPASRIVSCWTPSDSPSDSRVIQTVSESLAGTPA